jgi:Spx/MgsR family transcriptional regulator
MSTLIYGITTCDTVRKARRWLTDEGIEATFHDLRKDGLDAATLDHWLQSHPIDILLNRRGTSWRKLSDAEKADDGLAHLKALILSNPTLLKRPIIEHKGHIMVGFTAAEQDILRG